MKQDSFSLALSLPADWAAGQFLGRIMTEAGPTPIAIREGVVFDMSSVAPTISELIRSRDWQRQEGQPIGSIENLTLLSPVDLQVIKAAGVTFAVSAVERVIEEQARGDQEAAAFLRDRLETRIGTSIRAVAPGSEQAETLKQALIGDNLWSQYLEVAIGPYAEIFSKAPVLSTVGWGAEVGIRSDSVWNNPEPEVVLIVDASGETVGATLGNDVNLRDIEGRSALLLGKAKDNNASCAIGPFIRMFDDSFGMDDVRTAEIDLVVEGTDGYRLEGRSSMSEISRDPEELVRQAMSEHQYPDGFALFLGTLFAPTEDRDEPGRGFTHKTGDRVTISTPKLGSLGNRVTTSAAAAPWTFGLTDFMRNLARRGLLSGR